MILNTKRTSAILSSLDITISQFYLLHCIFHKDKEAIMPLLNGYKNVYENTMDDIRFLIEKGYLEYQGKEDLNGEIIPRIALLCLSESYIDALYVYTDVAGEEFYNAYPTIIYIDTKPILAKKGDKDDLMESYCKGIDYDKDKHQKILKAMKVAQERGLLNMAIRNFIESKLYLDILELDVPTENDNNWV